MSDLPDAVWANPPPLQLYWRGRAVASIWDNGTWHTWDRNGIGGENSREDTIEDAMREAEAACRRQRFIPKRAGIYDNRDVAIKARRDARTERGSQP